MNIILFDNDLRNRFLPLTYTRPVCEIRVGILTIKEKWEKWLGGDVSFITQDYLSEKYPIDLRKDNYLINGSVLPSEHLCKLISQMEINEAFLKDGELIAARINDEQFEMLLDDQDIEELEGVDLNDTPFLKLNNIWDIFKVNKQAIEDDFRLLTRKRESQPLSKTNTVIGDGQIFLEEGAKVECSILNVTEGPIYIGKNAEIMEGCMVRGGLALCDHAVLKMGAKVYGATTLGPHCKVGGEVSNSILLGYSNKAHDGYLGNSVLGEWCNLGADTNVSNLKNNYAEVKLWNYFSEKFDPTGLQFCGLIMGDHSKAGINTMFNTGSVVGCCANIFGSGFPRNFIPSYAWGGASGFSTFTTDKAFETIEKVMERRGIPFDTKDRLIMLRVFEESAKFRKWEKRE
ncbi:MAG: GlmU family protein [Saprospiraceae bacterium]|nr:GlmU family protein [Saprospiraceae bacterium]